MAKITLPSIGGGYATTTQLNAAFTQLQNEFQNKVLYRNNTSAESNVMENDIDLNKILNNPENKIRCRFYGIDMNEYGQFKHAYCSDLYRNFVYWRDEKKIFND